MNNQYNLIKPLQPNEVRVLHTSVPCHINSTTLKSYLKILSPQEHERYYRYRFDKDRYLHLFARYLLRMALSNCYPLEPAEWKIKIDTYGRPEIDHPEIEPQIKFNISHTSGIAAIALTLNRNIGIDVECDHSTINYLSIANRSFSIEETIALHSLPNDDARKQRFTEYWTLKEAYAKALGIGLSLPFNQLSFHLDDTALIQVVFDNTLQDNPENWKFYQFYPSHRHCIAIAIEQKPRVNLKINFTEVIPLDEKLQNKSPPLIHMYTQSV